MSDGHGHESAHATPEAPFTNAEIRELHADDVVAGRQIGKMLSILFVYTLIAMSIVSL